MPEDRLTVDVERLISEIATERRVQLNAREQHVAGQRTGGRHHSVSGRWSQLLEDETISEIMVNGPDKTFVERAGKVMLSNVRFRDHAHLANICQRIAAAVGRRIDESSPMVDARLKRRLPRQHRVPAAGARWSLYLDPKVRQEEQSTSRKLIEWKALTLQVARVLEIASQARLNVLISGGTGSGKTTLMNAMSRLIDPGERIVTVEDTAELQLQQPHVVRLETRPSSLEGRGEITQRDLMRNALRMRPDRIIIGEVRGGEAFDMLQAMNTGHDGIMSTIHANTTRDALTRIENMVQMGHMGLPVESHPHPDRQRHRADRAGRAPARRRPPGDPGHRGLRHGRRRHHAERHLPVRGRWAKGPDGKLFGRYNVSRVPPSFLKRLAYFGLDKAWRAALEEAENELTGDRRRDGASTSKRPFAIRLAADGGLGPPRGVRHTDERRRCNICC